MDVSAISAYKPQYDWRNMTARQIIKHDDDGDKVPAIYLQWAREFLNSVYADDVTTYELAISKNGDSGEQKDNLQKVSSMNDGDTEPGEEPPLSMARQERKDLEDAGTSIIKQAKIFRKSSYSLTAQSFVNNMLLAGLKGESDGELLKLAALIATVDSQMENIFSNLRNLKDLAKVNDSSANNDDIVQRADEQGKKLDQTATNTHKSISKTEGDLNGIGASMLNTIPTFETAQDYGDVTVGIAKEIPTNIFTVSLKISTNAAGQRAITAGKSGVAAERTNYNLNENNIDDAGEYHDYITQKSGIEAPQTNENTSADKQPKELKKDEIDSTKKDEIKKEDQDLPTDRETLVKLEDEDEGTKNVIVQNASQKTTVPDKPTNEEFADDTQKSQAANEFERAKENDGADQRTTTMAIRAESIDADNSAVASMGSAQNIKQACENTYNVLDENIQELMNEINLKQEEIKNAIREANTGGQSDRITRINQLNEELRTYGINAMSMADSTEGIINAYAGEIENIGEIFSNAVSKGNNAVAAGNSLIDSSSERWLAYRLINEIIGKNAINIGTKTSGNGTEGLKEQSQASSAINASLLSITSLKSEIQSKTGISSGAPAGTRGQQPNNEQEPEAKGIEATVQEDITKPNLEKPVEKVKDEDKAVKIAQNDGTDTNDKMHTDINAIMERKIRNGEIKMG